MDNPNGQAPEGATEPQAPASGLPSDVENQQASLDGFQLNDDFVAENFKDGKLFGRFDSIDGVLNTLKDVEAKYANQTRELKEGQKANEQQQTQEQQTQEQVKLQQDTIQSLVPEFMNNGMELTPEMETKATEAGIDIRDLKLGAIELRDRVGMAHATVGGKEQYEAMLDWAGEALPDADLAAFDKDVVGVNSRFAIKGLYAEYEKAQASGDITPQRLRGNENNITQVVGYATQADMLKDANYLETSQGKRDVNAQNSYRKRLSLTPDSVVYGR